jgi:hypothetical protein
MNFFKILIIFLNFDTWFLNTCIFYNYDYYHEQRGS